MTVTEHPLNFEHASTPEAAATPADSEKATRVWWLFDALYEKWKRLMTETDTKAGTREPRIAGNSAVAKNHIDIRVDANALSIIALMLAVAACAIVISQSYSSPQIMDAKIQAGSAEVRASVQQQVAQAQAVAHTAETHARVALDKVEDFRAKLAEKGIRINTDGH